MNQILNIQKTVLIFFLTLCLSLHAQKLSVNEGLSANSTYSLLAEFLAIDTLRYQNTSLAQGWLEDYYPSGELKHKGFYKNGKLLLYKNYFVSGICSQALTSSDPLNHCIETFYPNGFLNEQKIYFNSQLKKCSEYFENGCVKSKTEFDRENKLIIYKKVWYSNGLLKSEMKLTDYLTKTYSEKNYYDNGLLREEGNLLISLDNKSYKKNGVWNTYDRTGRGLKTLTFNQ